MRAIGRVAIVPTVLAALALGSSSCKKGESNGGFGLACQPDSGRALRRDKYGDPLPPGAVARLGTVRLRDPDELKALAFSADGGRVASASARRVRVWDAATGEELLSVEGRGPLAFSPDGRLLASAGLSGLSSQLHVVDTGKPLDYLRVGKPSGLRFSPDGQFLAVATFHRVSLWDLREGKKIREYYTNKGAKAMAFSRDGKLLAVALERGVMIVYDTTAGDGEAGIHARLTPTPGWAVYIRAINFSADRRQITTAGWDSTHLWDLARRKLLGLRQITRGTFHAAAFSADGTMLAAMCHYGPVRLYDLRSRKCILQLPIYDEKVDVGHHSLPVAISADAKRLAYGRTAHEIALWDVQKKRESHRFPGHRSAVTALAFSPDGQTLAAGNLSDGVAALWNPRTGKLLRTLRHKRDLSHVRSLGFSPDGRLLACGGPYGEVAVWELDRPKEQFSVWLTYPAYGIPSVLDVRFRPDGKTLAAARDNGELAVWAAASGKRLLHNAGSDTWDHAAIRPGGKVVALAGIRNHFISIADGQAFYLQRAWSPRGGQRKKDSETITLRDLTTGKDITVLSGAGYSIASMAFSSCGGYVAAGVYLQPEPDKDTGEPDFPYDLRYRTSFNQYVRIALMPRIRIWEVAGGRQVLELVPSRLTKIAFSPSGRILAVAGPRCDRPPEYRLDFNHPDTTEQDEAHVIDFWDLATGRKIATLGGQGGQIESVAFSPNERLFVTGSSDTTIVVWDMGPIRKELIALEGSWTLERLKAPQDRSATQPQRTRKARPESPKGTR